MIVVIADDFTGAAEIAGLGLRYGLKVEIESDFFSVSDVDLLIIATDTRSLNKKEAFNEVFKITQKLKKTKYDWLYKKTDSVFRGNIYQELKAILETNIYKKVLLIPANPSLGRKIIDGVYYINDQYLHETQFSEDPDFICKTSNVIDLLKQNNNNLNIKILKPDDKINDDGIIIGEAISFNDLRNWANKVDNSILPAGGAEFFEALLETKKYQKKEPNISEKFNLGKKFLFVCGSTFTKGKDEFKNIIEDNIKIFPMPKEVFEFSSNCKEKYKEWKKNILNAFNNVDIVIIDIDQPVVKDKKFSERLREIIARLVKEIINNVKINELLIEGGATVYSIAKAVGIKKFYPIQELAPGVIRMKTEKFDNLFVTIKPGSYSWPNFLINKNI